MSLPSVRRTVAGMPLSLQRFLEAQHRLRQARLQRAFRHVVQRDEVHMRRDPAQTADELLCHLRRVVDIADHGIFKGDPSPGLFKVAAAGIEELLHRPAPVHGHDAAADLVHRRVQRHGERQLQVLPASRSI